MKANIALSILALIIAASSLFFTTQVGSEAVQIAYVDNARVLAEYHGIIEGAREFEVKTQQWQNNLDTLEADVDRAIAEYRTSYTSMTDRERQLTEEIIQRKKEQFFGYKQEIEKKTAEEDATMSEAILAQIDAYLLKYGESHDFDFILGISERGNLLYAKTGHDITQEVIEGLNAEYEGK